MAKIEIRQAVSRDINSAIVLDHMVDTDYVFQLDQKRDESLLQIQFRRIQLPRSMTLAYPIDQYELKNNWQLHDVFLVALLDGKIVGFISGIRADTPATLKIMDIVVDRFVRRQGIATALLMAVLTWGDDHDIKHYVTHISPKNHAGLSLLRKIGFIFCGYNENHYPGKQMAFYFEFTR